MPVSNRQIATYRDPIRNVFAITPADATDLAHETRGIYVGVSGDIALIATNDTGNVTFIAVPQGIILPVSARQVFATGTTATNLLGVY